MKTKTFPTKATESLLMLAQSINPQKEHLTVEKLKTFPGCEQYDDEQAKTIIQSLEQLALIIFGLTAQNPMICIDNQQDVSLYPEKNATVIPITTHQNNTIAA